MKLCYGLLASGKQEQCDNLIQLLNVNGNQIVIQIDAKSEPLYQFLYNKYKDDKNIHFAQNRFDVYWGGITTTTATLNLMRETLSLDYDYFTMVSESCLPLYPDEEIKAFFERHKGTEFIDVRFDWTKRSRLHLDHSKPYTAWQRKHRNILAFRDVVCDTLFGWAIGKNKQFKSWKVPTTLLWYSITKDCLKYLVETIDNNHLVEKYQNTLIADEHIWAEVLYSSPYYDKLFIKGKRGGALLYCDWYTLNAPRLLTMKDYKKIYNPKYPCLYARKFDLKTEPEVVLKIYENRKNPDFKCKFE
jgi:hypothetical protein